MVPDALTNFFIASVGAGAALLGLLFVSVSISPEEKISANASIEKRIGAYAALTSLTNAFIISLVALIPGTFDIFVLIFSVATFAITFQNSIELLQSHDGPSKLALHLTLTLLSLFAYFAEGYSAVRLISNPRDSSPVYALTTLLVIVYVLSVVRAWELLGGTRRTPIHSLTTRLKDRTSTPDTDENKKTSHHTRRD